MSNEDMESWIQAIRNAIESALQRNMELVPPKSPNIKRHPIGDMFSKTKDRRTLSDSETRELFIGTVNETTIVDRGPNIIDHLRNVNFSNAICADCGGTVKTEWCSINLCVIICIGTSLI
jgi:hypothetical protein